MDIKPMIPPDYTALKKELGPCALHDHFGQGECPDCEVRRKLADALALAASLQEEKEKAEAELRQMEQRMAMEIAILASFRDDWRERAEDAEAKLRTKRSASSFFHDEELFAAIRAGVKAFRGDHGDLITNGLQTSLAKRVLGEVRGLRARRLAKAEHEIQRLQDEIERLKGYAVHAVGCKSKFCTCGLSREWHGESVVVGGIAIEKAKHAYVEQPCSCGLAPETGA